ncbi:hypothetical protein G3W01_11040 [Escherichia coli]|nr:hypothetical protein [Escherichia coli]
MRYIAFKRHRILISLMWWIAGKKIPAGGTGEKSRPIMEMFKINHIFEVKHYGLVLVILSPDNLAGANIPSGEKRFINSTFC